MRSGAGTAPNRLIAAMAAVLTPPGKRTVIEDSPEAIAAFLQPRPVRELPGVGARTAATLTEHGLHTVGDVADVPAVTLQRLLGARPGRTLHERAHGHDTSVVDPAPAPAPAPASISAEHAFPRDELDPAQHRRALLALADDLGTRLRTSDQIAQGLTCTIRYADQTATRRSRTLPEATHHTVLLARTAYTLYESLGLQRARVRSIALRADALQPAAKATRQLTLDTSDDKPLAIEAVADRAHARHGHSMLYPRPSHPAHAHRLPQPKTRTLPGGSGQEETGDVPRQNAVHAGRPGRRRNMRQPRHSSRPVPRAGGKPREPVRGEDLPCQGNRRRSSANDPNMDEGTGRTNRCTNAIPNL
ncbi:MULTISPECIES: DNA polymerase thumb domain-containing protein [unclassified Streptomyces]|uniref:DNA polymerase Y family protein n=1 Tax=unclassified Streptomyces TaxID=2593676 RepID=UPI002E80859D|nr:hypothetical protein [Streptomyces sp. NBC_00589]WTI33592.1 hypothetical protein OIC96_00420 [Streptomyces sp. NBC_00775]WUB32736.1 hypothetical protein OHA51_49315 [Streptomyces sp. NBC_00589]